jgi:hypothetical protein
MMHGVLLELMPLNEVKRREEIDDSIGTKRNSALLIVMILHRLMPDGFTARW